MSLHFTTDAPLVDLLWRRALSGLERNIITISGQRVLTVAPGYPGIWLEHAPHEGLLYSDIDPEVAVSNHALFLDQQKADGQICCNHLKENHGWSKDSPTIGFGQVQSIVSLTLTGAELCARTGNLDLAARLFEGGERWDAWFARHRDSEKLGLVQAFCVYDTGHDNSWRFGHPPHAVPNYCPDRDATRRNEGHDLPWYVPDMSASRLELRQGLAQLARLLERDADAERWDSLAATSRDSLVDYLFDPEDAFFYDRNCHGEFRRFRTEAALHPLRAGALIQADFDRMWERHLGNPARFWTHTPFPSAAIDDPAFNAAMPPNSWSGASQALTILRAPRWMERYGKSSALAQLLGHWRDLLANAEEFRQEADPLSGKLHPLTTPNYAGSLFVAIESIQRLHGIHRHNGNELAWNCRIPPGGTRSEFCLEAPDIGYARLVQENGVATLFLNNRLLASVRGAARIRTTREGLLLAVDGTSSQPEPLLISDHSLTIHPDTTQHLAGRPSLS